MDYFMNRKNVDNYTKMMRNYDNSFVLHELSKILPKGSSLLELGMGTGADLIFLHDIYDAMGSDNSLLFVNDFKKKSDIEVRLIDAVNIKINRLFDCIYSNKVLQHLSTDDFVKSLNSQKEHLSDNGIIFATLWAGEYREEFEFNGYLRFVYYDVDTLKKLIPKVLNLNQIIYYSEFEANDSLIIVLSKNSQSSNY